MSAIFCSCASITFWAISLAQASSPCKFGLRHTDRALVVRNQAHMKATSTSDAIMPFIIWAFMSSMPS